MLNRSSRVAVLGTGLMGRGIASVFADAGLTVTIFDSVPGVLGEAATELAAGGRVVGRAGSLTELVTGADLVTEAVVEDLELKQQLVAAVSELNPHAVIATNTSVLPVSSIAAHAITPSRVVGTHWWNPPDLIPIVEVVRGEQTDTAVVDSVVGLLADIGKQPVRVERDVPGFIGNRLQHALWREAIALIADGVCDALTVDLVVRNTIGLRLASVGPLENADLIGLDLTVAIHDAVLASLNRDVHPSPLLQRLVAEGRLGAKSGSGFLTWPDGARAATSDRLRRHVRTQLQSSTVPS